MENKLFGLHNNIKIKETQRNVIMNILTVTIINLIN